MVLYILVAMNETFPLLNLDNTKLRLSILLFEIRRCGWGYFYRIHFHTIFTLRIFVGDVEAKPISSTVSGIL
jgi:hypothetical protein